MIKCPKVEWSGFQTPFEIQTKKEGFLIAGPFENWSGFQIVNLLLDHFKIKIMFLSI
jgi:hypothetical protein